MFHYHWAVSCMIRKVSAEDIAIRGNGTGPEYMCPTRHFVYIFFNPVFQVSTAKNEINLFNNHVLIVAPVTFAPAGAMTPSAEFLSLLYFTYSGSCFSALYISYIGCWFSVPMYLDTLTPPKYWDTLPIYHTSLASVAQLDAPSDWRPGGRGFNPCRGRQHSFMEIDHEIFSTVILFLPLIQVGQLSVSG